jgi:membrane protease YdiL (CAAX protease family)
MSLKRWLTRRLWPGIAELGMAFAGLVLGYLVVGVVFRALGSDALMLGAAAVMTAVAAIFYGRVGPRWAEAVEEAGEEDPDPPALVAPRATTPGAVAGTIALGVVAALGGSMVLGLLFEWIGLVVQEQSRVLEIVEGAQSDGFGAEAIMLVVAALVLAPVTEEWFFRGLLFRRVSARSGRMLGYAISMLAFAAIHDNPAGFVVYLWLGLVFAAVLERTGRLWAAVAVHMGNNAYVLVMLFAGVGAGV